MSDVKTISMDDIMNASLGEVSNKLTVNFKKTVFIKSYETEVIESTTTVELENGVTAIERMFIAALLQVQMEYTAYCNLVYKGYVTRTEFENRKKALEDGVYAIKYKAETLLGEGAVDKYIHYKDLGE